MFNSKNSKKQGDIGLGSAINYFTSNGYTVCIPLTDSQEYDLVIDINNELKKIQVKTTSYIPKDKKTYEVNLRTMGGNRSWTGVSKKFDKNVIDYVFILTENDDKYFIPSVEIKANTTLILSKKYDKFKI